MNIYKSLGTDQSTKLEKIIHVTDIHIDLVNEKIIVSCAESLTSNGIVVKTEKSFFYQRFNGKINTKFDALYNTILPKDVSIGQGIIAMIQNDLNDYDGTEQSLKQL